MKERRIQDIENYVSKHENVSIDKLCSIFNVSKNTIRRDIAVLEEKGVIKKVYGGITLNHRKNTIPFEEREITNIDEKQLIAKMASELVKDGDIIFIDSGTTTMHMVPFLSSRKNLTIITTNLNVILKATPYENLNVISTGGTLYRKTNSLIGIEAINFLNNYNISKCFMATTGVSITKGVTNSSPIEYEIKKKIVEISDKLIILADSSKLSTVSLMTYCNLEDIDTFVTNKFPSKDFIDFFKDNNINLITPNKK